MEGGGGFTFISPKPVMIFLSLSLQRLGKNSYNKTMILGHQMSLISLAVAVLSVKYFC